jgi:hypothetical protein
LRYLIEEATGIATSSVYPDPGKGDVIKNHIHLKTPFAWGGYCAKNGYNGNCSYPTKNDIVIVKTHFPCHHKRPFDNAAYIKTIRLVRHPVDSFYSWYAFETNSNSPMKFVPTKRVKRYIKTWRRFQLYWNKQPKTVTFRYEYLLHKPVFMLDKILKKIGYSLPLSDIEHAVQQYPPRDEALKHLKNFKDKDLRLIASELGDLMTQFGYTISLDQAK